MVFSSEDVDICVTCVTDKPPKLPLREELVSLGVEVVLNASGIGEEAVRHESKRMVKFYRKEMAKKKKKTFRILPESRREKRALRARQKLVEQHILTTKNSISYDSYSRRLGRTDTDSESLSSVSTLSTLRSCDMGRMCGSNADHGTVEMPDIREHFGDSEDLQLLAISEAYKTFSFELDEADAHKTKTFSFEMDADEDHEIMPGRLSPQSYSKRPLSDTTSPTQTNTSFGGLSPESPEKLSPQSYSKYPLSDATSPTQTNTSFGAISPGKDEESEESTMDINHEKQIVSASGNRWWYASANQADDESETPFDQARDEEMRQEPPVESAPALAAFAASSAIVVHNSPNREEQRMRKTSERFNEERQHSAAPQSRPAIESKESYKQNRREQRRRTRKSSERFDEGRQDYVTPKAQPAIESEEAYNLKQKARKDRVGDLIEKVNLPYLPQSGLTVKAPSLDSYEFDAGLSQSVESLSESEAGSTVSKRELFDALGKPTVRAQFIQAKLQKSPDLSRSKNRYDGRLPLHAACNRNLPDRFKNRGVEVVKTLDLLVADIVTYKSVLETVASFNTDASRILDANGDLPIHLAARRLIEWEGQWRTKLEGMEVTDRRDSLKIDAIYREMLLCIEVVLDPIASSRMLCRKRGCIGRILPLHIACIFAVPFEKLSILLLTYPEAAGIPCDFGGLLTLMAENSLALELLERTRGVGEVSPSGDLSTGADGSDQRRSDILLAFNPNIVPFRFHEDRIKRLGAMIRQAATDLKEQIVQDGNAKLGAPARSAWVWICTFNEPTEGGPSEYSKYVENIVFSLDLEEVLLLAKLKTYTGSILGIATPQCAAIIKARLEGKKRDQVPTFTDMIDKPLLQTQISLSIPSATSSLTGAGSLMSLIQNEPEEHMVDNQHHVQHHVQHMNCPGALLKKLFNVRESSYPTSFIILPYKLVRGHNGALTLASARAAPVAVKFTQYLLEMTDPEYLKHQLDKKSIQHAAFRLPADQRESWSLREEKHRNILREFLEIYQTNDAYLYLLDEKEGIPVVESERGEKYYPIYIEDRVETVRRMLPLMLMGMIHMRGEKSLAILSKVIMKAGTMIPESWVSTSKEVLEMLSTEESEQDTVVANAFSLKDSLSEYVASLEGRTCKRAETTEDGFEWVVELTLLKLNIDRSDIRRSFAGLLPIVIPRNDQTVWTRSKVRDDELLVQEKSKHDDADSTISGVESNCSRDLESILGVPTSESVTKEDLEEVLSMASSVRTPSLPSLRGSRSKKKKKRSKSRSGRSPSAKLSGQRSLSNTDRPASKSRSGRSSSQKLNSQRSLSNGSRSASRSRAGRLASQKLSSQRRLSSSGRSASPGLLPRPRRSQSQTPLVQRPRSNSLYSLAKSLDLDTSSRSSMSNRLRETLEKQESELSAMRDGLASLDMSDNCHLSLHGEKLLDDISAQLSEYDAKSIVPIQKTNNDEEVEIVETDDPDVDETRKVLLRLCSLEEQLLNREIELQQLKVELHSFELEAYSEDR